VHVFKYFSQEAQKKEDEELNVRNTKKVGPQATFSLDIRDEEKKQRDQALPYHTGFKVQVDKNDLEEIQENALREEEEEKGRQ